MAQTETSVQNAPAPYPNATSESEHVEEPKKRNPLLLIIMALVLLAGGYYGFTRYQFAKAHESTDDAQVEGDVYPVLPRVGGPVLE
jgi:membrane fusion protein (multidrug efflux system)